MIECEEAVCQENPRKHRIVLAKKTVSGYVNQPAPRTLLLQHLLVCLRTEEPPCLGNNFGHGLKLVIDRWALLVRNTQNQRATGLIHWLLAALHVNVCARCVRNGEGIDQVLGPVKKSMERNVMEQLMRNHDQARPL